jgi:ATP-dependent Clp protease ATP-binding subunit ClpB
MDLQLTEPAKALIARAGYDPVYGARPLRRFIQRDVETRIGRALLSGEIHDGATITIDADDDELLISWTNPPGDAGGEEETEATPEEAVEAHA